MKEILSHPPTLETERLLIRPLALPDAEAIFEYASDPDVSKYVLFDTHRTIDDSIAFINQVLNCYSNNEPSALAIILKPENKLIGTIGYLNWHDQHKRIEIGYALSAKYWNQGIVTEASICLINFLFSASDLNRIEARCKVENIGSSRVMEKVGMKYEGTLREQLFVKGEFNDMKIYSILRHEWSKKYS
ncbi:MAG: GNAT family protein [bacterium]